MAKRKIATGDCETDPFKFGRTPKPFIWCIFDGEEYFLFDTAQEMIDFLSDKEWIVYFHNGGKFDYHFLLDYLEPFSMIMNINGRLSKFKIGDCEFRDSYNIIPQPLAAYKKDDFDYTKLEKNVRHKHKRDIQKYLMNDCLFLYELVETFIKDYGVNLTLASSAFKYFNKNFNDKGNQKTNNFFYENFAPYYYGGRVECFEKGIIEDDLECVDINSAYPYAMLHDHPYGNVYEIDDKLPKNNIGQSFIKLQCRAAGCFPFRGEDKTLSFPNDNVLREYSITGWEYLTAIKFDKIKDVKIVSVKSFIEKITFKNYVYHFYELKNNAVKDTPEYIISKLYLNSLYGKYAANPEKYKETFICPPQYIDDTCEKMDLSYGGDLGNWALLERPLPEEKQNYYNVATAASITGFVRAYLFEAMQACEGVVYCDTDSLFCRKHHLKLGDELGEWDIEGEFSGGGIGGKKLYAFKYKDKEGYKFASKGARLTPEEVISVCNGNEINYQSIAPTFSLKKEPFFLERKIKMT